MLQKCQHANVGKGIQNQRLLRFSTNFPPRFDVKPPGNRRFWLVKRRKSVGMGQKLQILRRHSLWRAPNKKKKYFRVYIFDCILCPYTYLSAQNPFQHTVTNWSLPDFKYSDIYNRWVLPCKKSHSYRIKIKKPISSKGRISSLVACNIDMSLKKKQPIVSS